jgi:hypothetical protein
MLLAHRTYQLLLNGQKGIQNGWRQGERQKETHDE